MEPDSRDVYLDCFRVAVEPIVPDPLELLALSGRRVQRSVSGARNRVHVVLTVAVTQSIPIIVGDLVL